MNINQNCRHFKTDKPCTYHKIKGVICGSCTDYDKTDMRILIIKLDALGDVLRTMAILPPLKKKYPGSHITWITRRNALPLFENVDMVDDVMDYADPLATHTVRALRFDLLLSPDTNKASATLASLVKAREKLGFWLSPQGEINFSSKHAQRWFLMGINDEVKRKNIYTYQDIILKICGLSNKDGYIPLKQSVYELKLADGFKESGGIKADRPIIGLNLGAGARWQNKSWKTGHYETLIKMLLKMKFNVVLYGGPEEFERHNHLLRLFKGKIASAGCGNSLREFIAKLSVCDVIVSSDTMAAHAALALGKRLAVLIGPTSINEFETYGRGIKLHADMDCLVCYKSICNTKTDCMDSISPVDAANAVLKLLETI